MQPLGYLEAQSSLSGYLKIEMVVVDREHRVLVRSALKQLEARLLVGTAPPNALEDILQKAMEVASKEELK